MFTNPDLSALKPQIQKILEGYVRCPSFSGTKDETFCDAFFQSTVSQMNYFQHHPNQWGTDPIEGDSLGRCVYYAFYQGESSDTVVWLHHYDVVNTDNYGPYQPFALNSRELMEQFQGAEEFLGKEAMDDLNSGDWLFGRGVADMKGGGAIQLALLDYCSSHHFQRSILVLGVPDEENLSLGMRHGVTLLKKIKEKYHLNYQLMVNSEPHTRFNPSRGVISQGSIGKMNIFIHVKGIMAHAGNALSGLNANSILAKLVSEIEMSLDFVDEDSGEMSTPPSVITLRDDKRFYDVSFPNTSYAILNILNYFDSPRTVVEKLKTISGKILNEYIDAINEKRQIFNEKTPQKWPLQPPSDRVFTWGEYVEKAELKEEEYGKYPDDILALMNQAPDHEPLILIGLLPPYYPPVKNKNQETLLTLTNEYMQKEYQQAYDNNVYFAGICDLSYAQLPGEGIMAEMKDMLGWNNPYHIPFDAIKEIQMPFVNIGPWGKNYHKPDERVLKEDLYQRTPRLIYYISSVYKKET